MPETEDIMKRFLNWFGCALQSKPAPAKWMHSFRPQLEQLDQRLVPSVSSAISIQHHTGWGDWTERDWYSTEPMAYSPERDNLVQYKGTTRYNLGVPNVFGGRILAVSASVDPNIGSAEAFVLEYAIAGFRGDWLDWTAYNALALC